MALPVLKPASYEDLFGLPENVVGEILHGQLIVQPRPAPKHALAASSAGGELLGPYQMGRGGPGGWWILDEPELHLGGHILVPDLAGWRRERMPVFPKEAFFTLSPDWVCEVISPSTARTDRVVKMPIYAGQGVEWIWLADPDARTLEVFRLFEGRWLREGGWQEDDEVRAPPFDATGFSLAEWWAPEG